VLSLAPQTASRDLPCSVYQDRLAGSSISSAQHTWWYSRPQLLTPQDTPSDRGKSISKHSSQSGHAMNLLSLWISTWG